MRFKTKKILLTGIFLLFGIIVLGQNTDTLFQNRKGKKERLDKPNREGRQGGNGGQKMNMQPLPNGNIIMGSPTANGITANVYLQSGSSAYIIYGKAANALSNKTNTVQSSENGPVEIKIIGLQPNSKYFYKVNLIVGNQISSSETGWFATQKCKPSTFSFGVQGDSHPERRGKMFSPDLYQKTVDNVAAAQPDFYFLMGDDFSIDRLIQFGNVQKDQVEKIYETQRQFWGHAGKNPPLFLVNGNHEQASKYLLDSTANNPSVLAANARKKYYPLPSPDNFYTGDKEMVAQIGLLKDYYAFEWGNALFVVIDPYWHSQTLVDNMPGERENKEKKNPWGITLGNEQYQWFKATLENSKAKYKFVFCHHVLGTGRGGVERAKLFEWGGYGQNGQWQFEQQRPGWAMPIHQLMVKNKVTIFFQGHDHLFARQELDGVIYQSVPNPADDTYTAFNRDAYTSGDVMTNSGFLNVTVSPKEVKVEYLRSYLENGTVLPEDAKKNFSYTIK